MSATLIQLFKCTALRVLYFGFFLQVAAEGQQQLFSSLTSSEETRDKTVGVTARCSLSPNTGSPTCDIPHSLSRWYYNSTAILCVPFNYTGCGGNANNFRSQIECHNICGGSEYPTGGTPMVSNDNVSLTLQDNMLSPSNSAIARDETNWTANHTSTSVLLPENGLAVNDTGHDAASLNINTTRLVIDTRRKRRDLPLRQSASVSGELKAKFQRDLAFEKRLRWNRKTQHVKTFVKQVSPSRRASTFETTWNRRTEGSNKNKLISLDAALGNNTWQQDWFEKEAAHQMDFSTRLRNKAIGVLTASNRASSQHSADTSAYKLTDVKLYTKKGNVSDREKDRITVQFDYVRFERVRREVAEATVGSNFTGNSSEPSGTLIPHELNEMSEPLSPNEPEQDGEDLSQTVHAHEASASAINVDDQATALTSGANSGERNRQYDTSQGHAGDSNLSTSIEPSGPPQSYPIPSDGVISPSEQGELNGGISQNSDANDANGDSDADEQSTHDYTHPMLVSASDDEDNVAENRPSDGDNKQKTSPSNWTILGNITYDEDTTALPEFHVNGSVHAENLTAFIDLHLTKKLQSSTANHALAEAILGIVGLAVIAFAIIGSVNLFNRKQLAKERAAAKRVSHVDGNRRSIRKMSLQSRALTTSHCQIAASNDHKYPTPSAKSTRRTSSLPSRPMPWTSPVVQEQLRNDDRPRPRGFTDSNEI